MNESRGTKKPKRTLTALVIVFALCGSACGSGDQTDDTAVEAAGQSSEDVSEQQDTDTASNEPSNGDIENDGDSADDDGASENSADDSADDDDADGDGWSDPPSIWGDYHKSRQAEISHWRGDIESSIGQTLPARLEPGDYETTQLGTPISFSTDRPLALIEENPGHILLADGPNAPDAVLYLLRPVGVFGPDRTLDPNSIMAGRGWSEPVPEDLTDWLESLDDLAWTELESTSVGGREASVYELSPAEDGGYFCQAGQCINLFPSGAAIQGLVTLRSTQVARMWEIEEEGADLIVLAKADAADPEEWFATVESMLDGMELGERAPAPSEEIVWDPRGIIGPGSHKWAGIDWVTTDFEVEYDFVNMKGYLSVARPNADGTPIGSPAPGDLFADLVHAETTREGAAIDSLDRFADAAQAGFGVGSAESIEPPDELVDLFGDVRSWRIEVPPVAGMPAVPLFHHAGLVSGEVWSRGAYVSSGFDELHAFERNGEIWVFVFSSQGVDELDSARSFGLDVVSQMTFDGAEAGANLAPIEGGTALAPGTWQADQLDTPVTFRLDDDDWVAAVVDENMILVQDAAALEREEPVRWFAVLEPTGLAAADELTQLPAESYSLPSDEFEQWLEAMSADDGDGPRAVVSTTDTTVAGSPATVVDLALNPDRTDTIEGGCGADRCYGFASLGPDALPLVVRPGEVYRFWFVERPSGVVVVASAAAADDRPWLDTLDPIIDSLAFD